MRVRVHNLKVYVWLHNCMHDASGFIVLVHCLCSLLIVIELIVNGCILTTLFSLNEDTTLLYSVVKAFRLKSTDSNPHSKWSLCIGRELDHHAQLLDVVKVLSFGKGRQGFL